jgi:hypothetical protein
MAQLYPQAPSTHFSRLLRHAWATVGLFFSQVITQGIIIIYVRQIYNSVEKRTNLSRNFSQTSGT